MKCCGRLKSDPEFMEIPVVVFSSSNSIQDIRTSYKLRANSYVKKPSDLDEFFATIAAIENFWTHTADSAFELIAEAFHIAAWQYETYASSHLPV